MAQCNMPKKSKDVQSPCCHLSNFFLFLLLKVSNALTGAGRMWALFISVKKYVSTNVQLGESEASNASSKDKQKV